jgi:hypothetical protein
MPCKILRGRGCDIIVLNIHAPTEGKTDHTEHSFYQELERVFSKFPKYHIKIILGGFNARTGRENILKQKIVTRVYAKLVIIIE